MLLPTQLNVFPLLSQLFLCSLSASTIIYGYHLGYIIPSKDIFNRSLKIIISYILQSTTSDTEL